ncbi:MAG: c-type cytochrome [Hyphomicrobium sp.]
MNSYLLRFVTKIVVITGIIFSYSFVVLSNDTQSSVDPKIIAQGKKIAAENCSRCHAISNDDKSKHEKAPAFRDLVKNYPLEDLAEALAEGIVSGHPDMPVFTFEPSDIDAFIIYLKSLSHAN